MTDTKKLQELRANIWTAPVSEDRLDEMLRVTRGALDFLASGGERGDIPDDLEDLDDELSLLRDHAGRGAA